MANDVFEGYIGMQIEVINLFYLLFAVYFVGVIILLMASKWNISNILYAIFWPIIYIITIIKQD